VSILRYGAEREVLVVTKGHPFVRDAFFAMFDALPDVAACAVEHPAAEMLFETGEAARFDATILYDMPGVDFTKGAPARFVEPGEGYRKALQALLAAGHGFVFLHHAIAGWPTWPEYARITGARFLYAPGEVEGISYPDSGYRHATRHRLRCAAPEHPVAAGLEDGFEITDELYLCPVLDSRVTPLFTSDYDFRTENFHSSARAVAGHMNDSTGWSHPPGSATAVWTHQVGNSPIVTILGGDDPVAYANEGLRRLLGNAIRWVSDEAARLRDASAC